MIRKTAIALIVGTLTGVVASCNSNSDDETLVLPTSAQVTAFSMTANSKVMVGLDSVYFSIDQLNCRIFNADSLPMGTDVTHLIPKLTVSSASIVEFHVSRPGLSDTIYNFIDHPTDSIDFSNPVRLRVVSLDGQSTATYNVKVNVHTVPSDTLLWSRLERQSLPSQFNVVTDGTVAHTADRYYSLTYYDGRYSLASAADPAGTWSYATPSFGFTPNLQSFNATDDALYVLDGDGKLYTSADGTAWTATGQTWTNIYGNHGDQLLGLGRQNGVDVLTTYPGATVTPLPQGFPVSGTSQTVSYTFEMTSQTQTLLVGGRTADGRVTGDTWSYDGSNWARISVKPVPNGLENATVFPYFTLDIHKTAYAVSRQSVLLAMNGRNANGQMNDTVYMSYDLGMHWQRASSLLQTGGAIPMRNDARAFVYKQTMTTGANALSRGRWTNALPAANLEAWTVVRRRGATKPITEWECPFIYMFGGHDANGTFLNAMYRGVINRFRFKPLQ